ncbi:MAG: sigma 54-interacting transcriptional regulator [Deltaproteobacteria bacterium]|nr:sigma 54-interacting transcriptional regulator [Deltaproteobacteria bacterium]
MSDRSARGPTEILADSSPHTRMNPSVARLVVSSGADKGRSVEVGERAVAVGSDPECALVLSDPAVSRQHLSVRREGNEAVLEDLGSTNGTFYGEARITEIRVGFGAELRVGRTRLRFVPAEEQVSIQPSAEAAFGRLLGQDRKMREIFTLLGDVAPTEATVIIEGETGTGKELVAHAIHAHSDRRDGPLEVFDCSSIPEDLIESALFGHVKGSFTGATQTRAGVFERASGGTVFLDEIGELDLSLQPKLLRVLEARQVQKVGGDAYVPVDVRVVAATNRSLRAEVKKGAFREDLYYRLAVVKIVVPPLRSRLDDLDLLARSFLEKLGADEEKVALLLSEANLKVLRTHRWPGNVRELRNLIERAFHLARGPEVDISRFLHDLGDGELDTDPGLDTTSARGLGAAAAVGEGGKPAAFKEAKQEMVDAFEREYLEDVLRRNRGNISGAAREAGIDRKHFKELLKKHGLDD